MLCGVIGEVTLAEGATPEPIPPCPDEATETVRFRCDRGHERERKVCDAHALILHAQAPFAPTFCLVCFDESGIESRILPVQ